MVIFGLQEVKVNLQNDPANMYVLLFVCVGACMGVGGVADLCAWLMFVSPTNYGLSDWIGATAAIMENTEVVIAVGLRQ